MNRDYLISLIYEYNPQVKGRIGVPPFKRHLYSELKKWINKKQIMAIVGLRRTGKTTLMKHMINEIGSSCGFFSFDEEETQTKEVLTFVIDFLLKNLKSKYVFLDEVHYVRDWQGVLKRHYDTKNIKFIISGSESMELGKAKESLAGRLITFKLDVLSFAEYLEMKGICPKIKQENINSVTFPKIRDVYEKTITDKDFLENEFKEYLYKGAFPELVDEEDEEIIRKYILDAVVKKIIYRDIPSIFEIKRKNLLFELFRYICGNSSNLFEIQNLCATLNADYETISNYIFYLQSAFLTRIAETYSLSIAKRMRRNKKFYIVHPSVAFSVLRYNKDMLIEKILGQYVESLFGRDLFWRDKHKNEVDLVIKGKKPIPVEVKYKTNLTKNDTKGLLKFMKDFNADRSFLITKNVIKRVVKDKKTVIYIPAWLFALCCKY